jgi:hypothetical protein
VVGGIVPLGPRVLAAEAFEFEVDREVLMYFSGKNEFMQQVARIQKIFECPEGSDEGPTSVIEPVGDPISAESRQDYRVSTISAALEARLGEEENLAVQQRMQLQRSGSGS